MANMRTIGEKSAKYATHHLRYESARRFTMLRYESRWFDSFCRLLFVRVFLWVNRKTELKIFHIIHIVIGLVRYRPGHHASPFGLRVAQPSSLYRNETAKLVRRSPKGEDGRDLRELRSGSDTRLVHDGDDPARRVAGLGFHDRMDQTRDQRTLYRQGCLLATMLVIAASPRDFWIGRLERLHV